MDRAEEVLAFGGDRPVHLARFLPAAEPAEAQARVVPSGQGGQDVRGRGRAFLGDGFLEAGR